MKKAKSKVVGKPAHHAKPAAPKKAKKHAAGAASKKHQPDAHQKHLAHLAAEHTAHEAHLKHIGKAPAKKRGLALGDAVACCAAEAVAASLRLSGRPVSDADVLALYRHTADDTDAGATILATLEAAARYGVSRYGVAAFRPVDLEAVMPNERDSSPLLATGAGLILGVELPGPHTVLATPDGWWSWGELYDPAGWPDAVIEEAWWVAWR